MLSQAFTSRRMCSIITSSVAVFTRSLGALEMNVILEGGIVISIPTSLSDRSLDVFIDRMNDVLTELSSSDHSPSFTKNDLVLDTDFISRLVSDSINYAVSRSE